MPHATLPGDARPPVPAAGPRGPAPEPPRGPVPFPRWQSARDRACAALLAGETRLLVTGPPGVGKTMLVQDLAGLLRFAGWTVAWRAADRPAAAAPVPGPGRSALLIDEADRMAPAELEGTLAGWPGPVLLAGLDSLAARWPEATRIALKPLDPAEAEAFVGQWLIQAGHLPDRLEPDAVREAAARAAGVPRLLASLVGAALWMAESEHAPVVTARHVADAAALRACFTETGPEEPTTRFPRHAPAPPPARRRWWLLPAGVVAAVVAAMLPLSPYWPFASGPAARVEASRTPSPPPPLPVVPPAPAPAPTEAASAPQPPAPAAIPAPEPPAAEPPRPTPTPALAAIPLPEPPASAAPAEALPPALVETLMRRGNEMMALGDVSAARLLFGRASASGNAAAMLAMGRTFDPATVSGLPPDPEAAAQWYRLAAAAGNAEAATLLQRMGRRAAQ